MLGILIALIVGFVLGVVFGERVKALWDRLLFRVSLWKIFLLLLLLPLLNGCLTVQGSKIQAFTTEMNYNCPESGSGAILRSKSWFSTKEIIPAEIEKKRLETIESIGGKK